MGDMEFERAILIDLSSHRVACASSSNHVLVDTKEGVVG